MCLIGVRGPPHCDGVTSYEGQDDGGLGDERDLLRPLLDLTPRDGFPHLGAAEGTIVFRGCRNVARVVEPALELAPPDLVMLRYPSPDHQATHLLRIEDYVGEPLLIADDVDGEVAVAVREEPDLAPDRAIHYPGDEDGNVLLLGPVEQRLLR